ncbi:glutamate receptor ionotropic, kainate 2-like [Condylostylus longicornis]|uniref:glutamate receptor ionotropic, kainate 2-like n=1 Tax=Condylostylus longicornis TaxID=2530218 RepID=UPI00244E4107|nr:glutamate receptor ionotropic, kainate 2-like [Condylostylus longicornis]
MKIIILCICILILLINSILSAKPPKKEFSIGAIFENENDDFDIAFRAAIYRVNQMEKDFKLNEIIKYADYEDSYMLEQLTCELAAEGVIAIFGPTDSDVSDIVSSICNILEIPHFLFNYKLRNPLHFQDLYSMTINMYPDESVLGKAIAEAVTAHGWRRYAVVYESNKHFTELQNVLELHTRDSPLTTFYEIEYDEQQQFLPFLKNLHDKKEVNLIINCDIETIIPLLENARELKMLGEYQSIFFIPLDTYTLDFGDLASVSANITTIRIVDPSDSNILNVVADLEEVEKERNKYYKLSPEEVPTTMLTLTDAVWLFAKGLSTLEIIEELEPPSSTCDSPEPWAFGKRIVEFIKGRKESGSTGEIHLNEHGKRIQFTTQILELTPDGFAQFSEWDPINGFSGIGSEGNLKRKEDKLQSKIFIVSSRVGKPFLFDLSKNDSSLIGNARYEGYSVDLIHEISKIAGFKYQFVLAPDGKYGAYDPSIGKWNGIVGQVMEGNADMGICDLTMTSARRQVVDFTPPFMTLGISILYAKADPVPPDLFSFRLPFSNNVWLYMSGAYVGISILFYIVARMAPQDWENPHPCNAEPEELENVWQLKNTTWLAVGSILGAGCDLLPKSASTRILAGFWWFFALILQNSYTANLAAFLTSSQRDTSIKSVEDLASQTSIKYGAVAGGSTQGFFKNSDEAIYQKMWSFMEAEDPPVWIPNNEVGAERVKKSKRLYACFMESTTLEYIVERECGLYQVGKWLDYKTYGIAMPFNSPWRKQISEAVLKLGETGMLVTLKRRWWKEKYGGGGCDEGDGGGGDSLELQMGNVGGVFLALGFGLIVAFCVGLVEFFFSVQDVALSNKISMTDAFIQEIVFAAKFWVTTKPAPKSSSKRSSTRPSHSSLSLDSKNTLKSLDDNDSDDVEKGLSKSENNRKKSRKSSMSSEIEADDKENGRNIKLKNKKSKSELSLKSLISLKIPKFSKQFSKKDEN